MSRVYLDYNATAPVRPEVRHAVEPLLFDAPEDGRFGNASSVHWAGQAARKVLELARGRVAALFGRKPKEVVFTSGGSEADNLALFGVLLHPAERRRHLVISAVEHPAVRAAAAKLERLGVAVSVVPVDRRGALDLEALARALERPAALVSVMAVNNETGVISPLEEVCALAHAAGAWLHVDAVQAPGRVPLPAEADLISLSGHKLCGLPGAGALVLRDEVPLESLVVGGPQERGRRAGTEPVAAAIALATALELAEEERPAETRRLAALRDRLETGLAQLPGARIVAAGAPRVTSTTSAVFTGVESDAVLQALDLEGVAASSGSACSSGSLEPSHVLRAMGYPAGEALAAVRFSLGWATTGEEVDRVLELLPRILEQVRSAA